VPTERALGRQHQPTVGVHSAPAPQTSEIVQLFRPAPLSTDLAPGSQPHTRTHNPRVNHTVDPNLCRAAIISGTRKIGSYLAPARRFPRSHWCCVGDLTTRNSRGSDGSIVHLHSSTVGHRITHFRCPRKPHTSHTSDRFSREHACAQRDSGAMVGAVNIAVAHQVTCWTAPRGAGMRLYRGWGAHLATNVAESPFAVL
jgi:hypothetical protein